MIKVNDIDLELQTNLDKLCKWANERQLPISYMKHDVLEIGRPGFAQYRMNSWTVAPVENVVDRPVTRGVLGVTPLKPKSHKLPLLVKMHVS